MGSGSFSSVDYGAAVSKLRATGATFKRSATAARTGDYTKIAEILNPRKLKDGIRECCFAPGFQDAIPIIVSIDGTGSMENVPHDIQKGLPDLIGLLTEQSITDHPNVMFLCHDDERALPPDAAFQMSQFETDAPKLLEALNELVIPGQGGGNRGEAYHLAIYAAANHTRSEAFNRDGTKGFFFMICDEEPFYDAEDPKTNGTTPALAKEVFGDKIQAEVSMLDSLKKLVERYHVFIIRPGHTSHGTNKRITRLWQDLLRDAGENPQNVQEIEKTEAIVPTMALTVGAILGADRDELADVLKAKGVKGVDNAMAATTALTVVTNTLVAAGKTSAALATTDGDKKGRRRR